jgi:hypothetical protein
MYTLRHNVATHLLEDGYYHAQRPLEHQNIELCANPIFMWFYFTDSINFGGINPK